LQESFIDITLNLIRCPKCGLQLDAGVPICPNDGTKVLSTPEVGECFQNKYVFVDRLAAGGMGVVFKAKQVELERVVAIKMLQTANSTPTSIRRFQIEAQALAKLDHPNLVRVFEMGVTDYGQPFTVMEFVDGMGLDELIADRGHLSMAKAMNVFLQVCDGLAYVHDYGILHRDLKPSNIMLVNPYDENPKVKLVDFGIAKIMDNTSMKTLTQTGEVFGSPLYMSPEQAKGTVVDQRADIYSLGCVFYEALSGVPPFWGTSVVEVILKQVGENAKPLNSVVHGNKFPNSLEAIVGRMLEKDPNNRYQSVDQLQKELAALASEHRNWYHIPLPPALEKSSLKPAVAWTLGIVGVLLLSGISCLIAFYALGEKRDVQNYKPFQMDATTLYQIPEEASKTYLSAKDMKSPSNEPDLNKASAAELRSAKLKVIGGREPLVSLDGENCPVETLAWLKNRKAKYITELEAEEQPVAITDATLPLIQDLPLLLLKVNYTSLTDKSIPVLTKFRNLEELEIDGLQLTAADCRALHQLKMLSKLNVGDCGLNDEAFGALCDLKTLKQLGAEFNKAITSQGLAKLPELPIARLALTATGIDDRSAPIFASLPSLQELQIGDTHITDQSLPYLEKIKSLRSLDLAHTQITDAGLSRLKMPALMQLRLNGCEKVTSLGRRNFAINNPQCQILFGQWNAPIREKRALARQPR